MKNWLICLFSILSVAATAQGENAVQQSRNDLTYLASDELAGRQPGKPGAEAALNFILNAYQSAEIDSVWTQTFDIPEPMVSNAVHVFRFYAETLRTHTGGVIDEKHDVWVTIPSIKAYPVRYSENGTARGSSVKVGFGITSSELEHDDYADLDVSGKIVIIDVSSPDGIHPHSQYLKYHGLDYRVRNAAEHGAAGVIFIQNDPTSKPPLENFNTAIPSGVPAIFVADASFFEKDNSKVVEINVRLSPVTVDGINACAFVDRGAKTTLVIGAHYDHLGYGGENSLYRGDAAIHNGADDNASGTAGLLHLVRKHENLATEHNLLFIAFSGEERGLIGSDAFTKADYFRDFNYVAMLNMDMIGRLDSAREILVSGTGTASEWDQIVDDQNTFDFKISKSAGGTGASDHTSFYQMDIPVLHFFTGTHEDYHKPSDDADKINYEGLIDVADYLAAVANAIPSELTFQKTVEESQSTPRFNVTLGIIPDYVFGGPGVRVDGVSDGKPASKAGIEAGDIIMKIGDFEIAEIYAYMRALGAFNPGDTTTITLIRNEEELELELTF